MVLKDTSTQEKAMVIVFTADTHFDSAFTNENSAVRNGELVSGFEGMLAYARRIGAGAVLIGGDIFDTPYPSKEICAALTSIIKSYGDLKIFAVAGNHDPLYSTAFYSDVPENLHVFGGEVECVDMGDFNLYGVSVKSAGDCRDPWADLRCKQNSVILCHGMLDGEGEFSLSSATLADTGADLVLLGHIHNTFEKPLSNGSIALYAGSPAGRGFDECGERGFYVIDTDTKKREYIKSGATRYTEYEADISGTASAEELVALLREIKPQTKEIARVVLTGELSEPYTIDCAALCGFLPQFTEIKDRSKIDINITKNIAENTLEGRFLRILEKRLEGENRQKILDAMKAGVTALRDK